MLFSTITKFTTTIAILSQIASAAPTPADIQSQALTAHNGYRQKHHVNPLTWDTDLATHAQSVSDKCVFAHSVAPGTGQNMAYGYATIKDAIDAWYNEVNDYNYFFGGSLLGQVTGHFTQVVWKNTSYIGCSVSWCEKLVGGVNLYVCDYKAPGNYIGKFSQNVLPP